MGLPAAASLVPPERNYLEALGESLRQCQLYQYQRLHFPESRFSFLGRVDLFFSTPSYPVMFWAPCMHWCPQPLARICLVPGGVHKILLSPERKMLGKKRSAQPGREHAAWWKEFWTWMSRTTRHSANLGRLAKSEETSLTFWAH